MVGGAVSWSSRKQTTVVLSTTEAEYMAANVTTSKAIPLCQLLSALRMRPNALKILYIDNQSAISLIKNAVSVMCQRCHIHNQVKSSMIHSFRGQLYLEGLL